MPEEVSRVFQPLSGEEVREVIVREVRRVLDNDPRFEPHLAFPVIDWDWKLTFRLHHSEDSIEHQAGGKFVGEEALEALKQGKTEVVLLSGSRKSDVPDEIRVDVDLPVSVPTPTPAGTFDLMENPPRREKP